MKNYQNPTVQILLLSEEEILTDIIRASNTSDNNKGISSLWSDFDFE